jgi:hypothetical protein
VRALPTLIVVRGAAEKLRLDSFVPVPELRAALARIRCSETAPQQLLDTTL